MNKVELIKAVAQEVGLKGTEATPVVEAVFSVIQEALASGDFVNVAGFGKFEVRETAARKGRNPQDGTEIDIPASKKPAFKSAKALRDIVKSV